MPMNILSPNFIILEDHPLVLSGIRQELADHFPEGRLIYSGSSLEDAIEAHKLRPVDCAVVDLDLGDNRSPAHIVTALVENSIPTLVVSVLTRPKTVQTAMSCGALGFVSKNSDEAVLIKAIRSVLEGDSYMSPELAGALSSPLAINLKLSTQESRALILYASGLTLEKVAAQMGLASSTVKEYLDRVRDKYSAVGIQARTKTELYKQAVEDGLIR
jgi:DNA-binding NarL/FixJ family response regulator